MISRRHAKLPLVILLVTLPAQTPAQDEGGMIQRFLQDKLSSAGREVQISGFEGLLAGNARLAELTIADEDGVWLTLRDAVLDWNRAALLRGRLSVEELSAGEIIIARRPIATTDADAPAVEAPKAEASGFSLPELPVAIRIDKLSIARAELGETVIGEAAVLSLDGSVVLADGEGNVDISATRIDGKDDHLDLRGGFVNESGVLTLDLELAEGEGGLVGTLLKLPDEPTLDLSIEGEGPLTDFTADIGLRTDDQDRVTGTVALKGDESGGTDFDAEIGGDVTPLLPAEFHDFFGTDIRLVTRGTRPADGSFDLQTLTLTAQSLALRGNAEIGSDGMPRAFDLQGEMADADGDDVRLPIAGPATTVGRAQISATYDVDQGEEWNLEALVQDAARDGAGLGLVAITGLGTIDIPTRAVTGGISFQADRIALADPALTEAIGGFVAGSANVAWQQDSALEVTSLRVDGADYGLQAKGDARISDRSVKLSADGSLRADDLSRFAAVSGQDLTGRVSATFSGQGDPLGGDFAVTLDVEGDGLAIGQETADRLLADPVTIALAARRGTDGTTLDRFELRSKGVTADAKGKVGGGTSDIGFEAALTDVGLVLPGHEGALTVSGDARETDPGDWQVGLDLDGPYALTGTVDGRIHPGDGDVTLDLSLPDIAPLVPGHEGPVSIAGTAKEAAAGEWNVDLDIGGPYDLTAAVEGLVAPQAAKTDVTAVITLPDIAPLAPGFTGAVALNAAVNQTDDGGWAFDATGTGPYESDLDLAGTIGTGPDQISLSAGLPDLSPLVPGIAGPFRAEGTATDNGDGRWQIDFDANAPYDALATVDGVVGGGTSDLALDVSVPDLSPLVPQLQGPLKARVNAAEDGTGLWDVNADIAGPYDSAVTGSGKVGASGTNVAVNAKIPDIAPLAPGFTGAIDANATAAQADDGAWDLTVDAAGPYSSTVTADGTIGAGRSEVAFEAAVPNIAPVAPGLSGPLAVKGAASEAGDGAWNVDLDADGPYNSTATVSGNVGAAGTKADLVVNIPSVAPFAPGLVGSFEARGNVAQDGTGIAVDLATSGPEAASSTITGTIAPDFSTLALAARGSVPLAIANRALSPNAVQGDASFDLAVNGAPSLQAVSGTVTVQNAQMSLPAASMSLDDIDATIGLNGSTVQINSSIAGPNGGSLDTTGTIDLNGPLNANIQVNFNAFGLTDPLLYETSLNGGVTVTGPLTGNASIGGRIEVGRTEIRIPEAGLGFGGSIPTMTHINEPFAVHRTREWAGLVVKEKPQSSGRGGSSGGPVYNLDVRVVVPGEVFIRGRGLDTELGGTVVIRGTTAAPKPVGEIEVIRGRMDLLGRRLDVDEGTVSLAGGLEPYLDITASSKRDDFEFLANVTGPIDDPAVSMSSVPDLPKDEVLAYFLFGKSVTDLSALQAVQLASAVATLSGRGGPGVLGGLREGLGLDDLDLTSDSEGEAEVRAGKYLTDNVYSEFVVDSEGDTEIDLNVDVSDTFTLKGTATSSGDSSIGFYWERDY